MCHSVGEKNIEANFPFLSSLTISGYFLSCFFKNCLSRGRNQQELKTCKAKISLESSFTAIPTA